MSNKLRLTNSPTDAFVQFFLDSKPYHTKLLEIVETYTFSEEMVVKFEELLEKEVCIENDPLCKPTGFGLVYDDTCGYDAIDCCSLFDCFGGYGIIFDNNDQLLDLEVVSYQVNDDDLTESYIEVLGNRLTDKRLPIKKIESGKLYFEGDVTNYFNVHKTFLIVNVQQFTIVDNTEDEIQISGDHASFFSGKHEAFILNTNIPNTQIFFNTVEYDSSEDLTILKSSLPLIQSQFQGLPLKIRNVNNNNGIYQSLVNSFDPSNNETEVEISFGTLIDKNEGDYNLGSVQLRTALKPPRSIDVLNVVTGESKELSILHANYDSSTGNTRLIVNDDLAFLDGYSDIRLRTFGYFFENGFDGGQECSVPKNTNIHVGFQEKLIITYTDDDVIVPEYCFPIECPDF